MRGWYIVEESKYKDKVKEIITIHLINFAKAKYIKILINRETKQILITNHSIDKVEYRKEEQSRFIIITDAKGEQCAIDVKAMEDLGVLLEIDRSRRPYLKAIEEILDSLILMIW